MFCKSVVLILTLLNFDTAVNSAKILVVVPTPSISHQIVFRPLVQGLLQRNHEVVVITADPVYTQNNCPKNLTEIDLHDLSYKIWNQMLIELQESGVRDTLSMMTIVFRALSEVISEQFKNYSIQKLIEDKTVKFDLLIIESCAKPALIFSHLFNAPLIQMSSFGTRPGDMEMVGAATHPFLYPTYYHQKLYNLTVRDKVYELSNHILFDRMLMERELEDDVMLRNIFGKEIPTLNEMKKNVQMLFLNIHPIWTHNEPVPPNVVYIWGIHKPAKKPLPQDLQSYLDSSTNGVIYVSFGTNVKSSWLPAEKLEILVRVLSRLPYEILWKWDLDELPGRSENIRISKWYPQSDLLRHPKLKLFITQGGLQSTDEAINAGVPLIGIPMFADQEYNTAKYPNLKIGMKLHIETLTEDQFNNAVTSVLEDDNYRKNIIQLRVLMHDQPQSPLERAIWWTEHVIRHGGARHLRSPAANMSLAEYYELELILVILIGLLATVTAVSVTMFYCFKCVMSACINKLKKT